MNKVILATTNKGKQKEFQALLAPLHIQVLTVEDFQKPPIPEVIEDGQTFEENALKKAKAFYEYYQLPALADDSGLEVDALHGEPGVYSARYAGEGKSDEENNRKLLTNLQGVPEVQRKARFICVIAFVDGVTEPLIARGNCEGFIAEEPKGSGGFGYDPLFYLPQYQKTMAELTKEEKNRVSHRAQALQKIEALIKSRLLTNEPK